MQAYYRYSNNNNHSNSNDSSIHHASMIDPMLKRDFIHHSSNDNTNNTSNKRQSFSRLLRSRVYIHWRAAIVLLLAICIGAILIATSPIRAPNSVRDYESVFASITNRRVASKWRGYLNRKTLATSSHPKLYYPRQCPTNNRSCAKLIPSFIFAGSELSGTTYIFNTLQTHPQVIGTVDHQGSGTLFDKYDEALFEAYLSQFPTLQEEIPLNEVVVAGEHAPQYLYRSHIAARRLRELLPHVKLVFILRDPIDRAYSQYFAGTDTETASFETMMETELDILRQCGHTTTGWEGFVRCHESNEIRAARDPPFSESTTGTTTNSNCTVNEECENIITTANNGADDDKGGLDSLARGMYYTALLPFLNEFPASQIFVKRTEDFLTNPSASFQSLARFLGIDPTYFSERNFYKHHGITESMLFGKDTVPPPAPDVRYYHGGNSNNDLPYHSSAHHHHSTNSHNNNNNVNNNNKKISALALEDGYGDEKEDTMEYDYLPNFVKSPSDIPILDLGTRYRLQKVFRSMNQRLLDLFERGNEDFPGWDYDVERG